MFKPLSYDIKEVTKLFSQKRSLELRGLSNRLIREASMQNDYSKAQLGVIAYALHKMESKNHFVNDEKWILLKEGIVAGLKNALFAIQQSGEKQFAIKMQKVIDSIISIDSSLGNYAQNIYDKAKVKQASLAYSYGLSLSQSAELTGADKKELQSYIGFTTMHDEEKEIKSLSERVVELKNLVKENR
ncbi:MAG: hypothetical protein PHX27_01915 [Candidatus ainarchaeum sp.]|nr:hypothetical protein [Candidatus ainarchaeum sp.]